MLSFYTVRPFYFLVDSPSYLHFYCRLEAIFGHVRMFFQMPSLHAKITFELVAISHYPNSTEATSEQLK